MLSFPNASTKTCADEAGGIYHALNRGNSRSEIFRKEEDYAAFERILAEGLQYKIIEIQDQFA